jgi:hypothetical protein
MPIITIGIWNPIQVVTAPRTGIIESIIAVDIAAAIRLRECNQIILRILLLKPQC